MMKHGNRRAWFGNAAAVTLLLWAGACGTEGRDDALVISDTAAQMGVAAGRDTLAGAAATGAAGERTIQADLTEWAINLSRSSVTAGEVTFRVRNSGTMHHALEVEGEGVEEETEHLPPGQNATLTVRLQPGTYEVYCPVTDETGSHREQGMTTRLVVQ